MSTQQLRIMRKVFVLTLVAAAAFVWLTANSLPPAVASHFGPGGAADGRMSRASYTAIMIAVVVGAPLIVALLASFAGLLPPQLLNLPNMKQPPVLSERWMFLALGVFGLATLVWLGGLFRRFGRVT